MKIAIEAGHIKINLQDLIEAASTEERATIIDHLACHDEIIDEVMNQVIDGWTTMGGHAGTGYGGNVDAVHGLDGARMRIAKASGEIAAREIERLGDALKREKAHSNDGWAEYHALMARSRGYA